MSDLGNKQIMAANILHYMDVKGVTRQEICNTLNFKYTTFCDWINAKTYPRIDKIEMMANYFGIEKSDLVEKRSSGRLQNSDNLQSISLGKEYGVIRVPVYGRIPAGQPLEAIEDILGYEEISAKWANGGKEFFALEIKGDSMYPEYHDGDIIIFQKQPDCESGQDCAVAINGDEWTFKRIEKNVNGVIVKPLNPAYETKFFSNDEVITLPVEVKGVIWELRRPMQR